MIYILMIWTVVGIQGTGVGNQQIQRERDWRPLGEFHRSADGKENAQDICEKAARQLGLKTENYRCIRSK